MSSFQPNAIAAEAVSEPRRHTRVAKLARIHISLCEELDALEQKPLAGADRLHAEVIAGSLRGLLDQLDELLAVEPQPLAVAA